MIIDQKKMLFFLIPVCILALFISTSIKEGERRYDTLGGKIVTTENFHIFAKRAPGKIEQKVRRWFEQTPGAYDLLVVQDAYLTDVANLILKGYAFFKRCNIKNLGNLNYVFQFPGDSFFIKIFGPNNRFLRTVKANKIPGISVYVRDMQTMVDDRVARCCNYMDFEADAKRIKRYFYASCSQIILDQKPTKKQIKKLIYLLAGAFPQVPIRSFIAECLIEKYLTAATDFTPQSIEAAFNEFLTLACKINYHRCFRKGDLIDKKFINTYNAANRLFFRNRFEEAIDIFGLDKLEKPPNAYIVQVNNKKLYSCSDRDVVLVQECLDNHRPFIYYLERPDLLDQVFTEEVMMQILVAMEYAGLWDITGKNIHINKTTKKITYIDFEQKNDTLPTEIFNKSETKRRLNSCYLMLEFLKRFPAGTLQRKVIDEFIAKKGDYIDFAWYREQAKERDYIDYGVNFAFSHKLSKASNMKVSPGPLGKLLYFADPMSDKLVSLRKQVSDMLTD